MNAQLAKCLGQLNWPPTLIALSEDAAGAHLKSPSDVAQRAGRRLSPVILARNANGSHNSALTAKTAPPVFTPFLAGPCENSGIGLRRQGSTEYPSALNLSSEVLDYRSILHRLATV